TVEGGADGVFELRRDAVGADEVHARPERDGRELGRRAARSLQPVHRLVEGAVAPDRDDEAGTAARGLLREVDQVARPLGEERLAVQAEAGRAVRKLRPA